MSTGQKDDAAVPSSVNHIEGKTAHYRF